MNARPITPPSPPRSSRGAKKEHTEFEPIPRPAVDIEGPFFYTPPLATFDSEQSVRPQQQQPSQSSLRLPIGETIPVLVGQRRVNARLWHADSDNTHVYTIWLLCDGGENGIDTIEDPQFNGRPISEFSGGILVEKYYGTQAQTVCSFPGFTDPLTGIAYLYIRFNNTVDLQGVPLVQVVCKGLEIYDTRTETTGYSNNPALIKRWAMSWQYGGRVASADINAASVSAAANHCDVLLGTVPDQQKRYEFNFLFAGVSLAEAYYIIDLHYLGAAYLDGLTWKIDYARPKEPVANFADGETWDFRLEGAGSEKIKNQIWGQYLDPTLFEPVTPDPLEAPDLGANDPIFDARYDLTGFQFYSQFLRVLTYLLNSLRAKYLSFRTINDKGLQPGDVFTISKALHGLAGMECEVTEIVPGDSALIYARVYDPDWYDDAVVAEPTYGDTTLPSPSDTPGDVSDLLLEDVLDQLGDGSWVESILVTFGFSTWPWVHAQAGYEIYAKQGSGDFVLVATLPKNIQQYKLRAIISGVQYTVKVVTASTYGPKSAGVTETITPDGKLIPPVWKTGAALAGEEAGDIVWLRWYMSDKSAPAVDLDIAGYQLRRGRTTDTWETASVIDPQVDALSYQDKTCPAGTWRYFMKAIDAFKNETETAKSVDVTVSLNPNLGFQQERAFVFTGGTLTNVEVTRDGVLAPFSTSYDTLGERFPGTNLGDGVGGNAYLVSPAPATAEAISTVVDLGSILSGQFTLYYGWEKLGTGTATLTPKLLLSTDNVNWTEHDASSTFSATARYVKGKFSFTSAVSTTTYVVKPDYYVRLQLNLKGENGTATISGTGSLVVTFKETYVFINKIRLTSEYVAGGANPHNCVYDSLSLTQMTLKNYDNANTLAAGVCRYEIEGY